MALALDNRLEPSTATAHNRVEDDATSFLAHYREGEGLGPMIVEIIKVGAGRRLGVALG